MKVILRSDVPSLGRSGEIKQVSAGFGRNYLIPRKLAMPATPSALSSWEAGRERRTKKAAARLEEIKVLAAKLSGVALSFSRPAAEGKLFGSVGKTDIWKSLKACGYSVDKEALALDGAIKTLGEHDVELKLLPEVSATIKVTVSPRQ
ncbi:MAG: 50S ribosomal protein L9 [Elusimicrobiota bacterium]